MSRHRAESIVIGNARMIDRLFERRLHCRCVGGGATGAALLAHVNTERHPRLQKPEVVGSIPGGIARVSLTPSAQRPHGPLPGNPRASGMAAWPMDGRCHPPALGEGRDVPTPVNPTGLGPPPQVARAVLHRPRGGGSRAGEPCWGAGVGKAGALRAICASRPARSARVNTAGCRPRGSGELQVSLPRP